MGWSRMPTVVNRVFNGPFLPSSAIHAEVRTSALDQKGSSTAKNSTRATVGDTVAIR